MQGHDIGAEELPSRPESGDEDGEISRVITRVSWWALPFLAFFALRALWVGEGDKGVVLLGFGLVLLANVALYFQLRRDRLYKWLFIGLVTSLFFYLVLSGVEGGTGIFWLYVFPPLVFYLSDLRLGRYFCLFGLAAVAILFTPVGTSLGIHPYSMGFKLAFLSSLSFEMMFCYMLDRSRRHNQQQLIDLAHQFEYAAKHDSLTGLNNRREGHFRLQAEHARWQRNGNDFAILLLDIDRFKIINDTWGHDAGDAVIRKTSEVLVQLCRKSDMVARWGGEEFLILLPETSQQEAMQTAERIREQLAALKVEYRNQQLTFTASLGVARIRPNEDIDSLLRRADEYLYKAKNAGRNQVMGD